MLLTSCCLGLSEAFCRVQACKPSECDFVLIMNPTPCFILLFGPGPATTKLLVLLLTISSSSCVPRLFQASCSHVCLHMSFQTQQITAHDFPVSLKKTLLPGPLFSKPYGVGSQPTPNLSPNIRPKALYTSEQLLLRPQEKAVAMSHNHPPKHL